MPTPTFLPYVVNLDDADDAGDIIDALALDAFASGVQPCAYIRHLERVRPDARLIPAGIEPSRVANFDGRRVHLAVGDGWTLTVIRWKDRTARVQVTATGDELAKRILDAVMAGASDPANDQNEVVVSFWHLSNCGPRRSSRSLLVAPWPEIRRNYTAAVGRALERLMRFDPHDLSGRLLLLHGPPGTGKTTALRALADAWRDWCRLDYIVDPDRLFRSPSYLLDLVTDDDGEDDKRWRLLLLEDCDELIRGDAKSESGQALARLLNLSDGLLGQGLKVLLCITTNEDLARLHPAIVRPGRCLAQIHVDRLSPAEASAWLGAPADVAPSGATLAELFARRGDLDQVTLTEAAPRNGLYL